MKKGENGTTGGSHVDLEVRKTGGTPTLVHKTDMNNSDLKEKTKSRKDSSSSSSSSSDSDAQSVKVSTRVSGVASIAAPPFSSKSLNLPCSMTKPVYVTCRLSTMQTPS